MAAIDRNSFKPLYHQIGEALRVMIEDGMSPGEQIPSENELISRFKVSRNTVRLATDALIKQGLVYRIQGRGTFVAPARLRYGLFQLASFSEEMRRRGRRPGSRIVNLVRHTPLPKVTQRLGLEPHEEVFEIERLRLADEEPLALNTSCVPCALCPTLAEEDLISGSLYDLLEGKYGFRLWRAEQVLKPTIANDYEAHLLCIEPGSPLLLVEGVTFVEGGKPIEYAKLLYRGDRYEFSIHALRQPEAA